MKVLILPDRLNWAYHSIAKAIAKFNTDPDISFHIEPIKKNKDKIKKIYKQYDLFFVMGYQTYYDVSFLPKNHTITGIHSHHQFDNRKTTPESNINPPKDMIKDLSEFPRFNAVSRRLYDLFKKNRADNVYLTENGVDSSVFVPVKTEERSLTVGYSGSKKHDWRKGVSEFILPAAKKASVKAEIAMLSTGNYVPLEDMPNFYSKIDAYICASTSEGFSLSVLEAASCGKPVISTRVGGCVDLIDDGVDGFLVDRDIDSIVNKINKLKNKEVYLDMSKAIRHKIVTQYDWSKKIDSWISFIKA